VSRTGKRGRDVLFSQLNSRQEEGEGGCFFPTHICKSKEKGKKKKVGHQACPRSLKKKEKGPAPNTTEGGEGEGGNRDLSPIVTERMKKGGFKHSF